MSRDDAGAGGPRSFLRAIGILDYVLSRGEPVSVADIVRDLGLPKSTAYELVRAMQESGCLEQPPNEAGVYLGRRLYEFGMAYRAQVDLLKEGNYIVERLRDETGETVQLSVLDDDLMLVLAKEESPHPIRIISRIGSRVPVNWAAAGRLLVSDMDDASLRSLLERSVCQSPAGKAVTDVDTLMTQIRQFRARGYGSELNEANDHAGCVAAPVVDGGGHCVAAISIVVPEQRLDAANRKRLIEAVRRAAAELSARIGGPRVG